MEKENQRSRFCLNGREEQFNLLEEISTRKLQLVGFDSSNAGKSRGAGLFKLADDC